MNVKAYIITAVIAIGMIVIGSRKGRSDDVDGSVSFDFDSDGDGDGDGDIDGDCGDSGGDGGGGD